MHHLALLASILIKWIIGLHPHSGQDTPPMYGDFEAQRHWMEITANLPIKDWYHYDTEYWGLDYPPLTAYHSFFMGKICQFINPEYVALETSRGNQDSKLFMRSTALISDLFVYSLAVLMLGKNAHSTLVLLLNPTLLIIDHGHFQYNSVMLGLSLFAIKFLENPILCPLLFSLALGFKQMALFYALPFFFVLLGGCIERKSILRLICIGSVVIITWTILLFPFADSLDSILHVFKRVFPVERGLFEDKVANFWCAIDAFVKLRKILSLQSLMKLSAISTIVSVLPSGIHLLFNPTARNFRYSLFCTSLGFFMFSFQVHEKSILLPAMVILMIEKESFIGLWFTNVAMYSMLPLLIRDDLFLPTIALTLLFNLVSFAWKLNRIVIFCHLVMIGSMVTSCLIDPPVRYPHIHVLINVWISAGQFLLIFAYMNYKQIFYREQKRKLE